MNKHPNPGIAATQFLPSRLLDRELEREDICLLSSNVCASTSGLVCALGVADQSRTGAIEVFIGGGDPGLLEIFCGLCYQGQDFLFSSNALHLSLRFHLLVAVL